MLSVSGNKGRPLDSAVAWFLLHIFLFYFIHHPTFIARQRVAAALLGCTIGWNRIPDGCILCTIDPTLPHTHVPKSGSCCKRLCSSMVQTPSEASANRQAFEKFTAVYGTVAVSRPPRSINDRVNLIQTLIPHLFIHFNDILRP